jgi:hypothetical protein
MGQRNELRQNPSNGRRKRRTEVLAHLKARSEDRNRAASLFDSSMRLVIGAKFNSLLAHRLRCVNAKRVRSGSASWPERDGRRCHSRTRAVVSSTG